jgi:hypothetical protein
VTTEVKGRRQCDGEAFGLESHPFLQMIQVPVCSAVIRRSGNVLCVTVSNCWVYYVVTRSMTAVPPCFLVVGNYKMSRIHGLCMAVKMTADARGVNAAAETRLREVRVVSSIFSMSERPGCWVGFGGFVSCKQQVRRHDSVITPSTRIRVLTSCALPSSFPSSEQPHPMAISGDEFSDVNRRRNQPTKLP